MDVDIKTVLVVGTAKLPMQLDLEALEEDLEGVTKKHEDQPGLYFYFEEGGDLVTFNSGQTDGEGSYTVRASTRKDAQALHERVLDTLKELGVPLGDDKIEFEFNNFVACGDLNKQFRLEVLTLALGLENTNYEPEDAPHIVYRHEDVPCTTLIFGNGKVTMLGGKNEKECMVTLQHLADRLQGLFPSRFEEEIDVVLNEDQAEDLINLGMDVPELTDDDSE